MADAVRAWPAAAARVLLPRPLRGGPATPAAGLTPTPLPEATLLGRTARGGLALRHDARLGRLVLAETLDQALDDETRASIAALAAAGGPRVQRVLRLDEPPGEPPVVFYELLPTAPVPLAALAAEEAALLGEGWEALAPLGVAPAPDALVARTSGGPVILVVAPHPEAYSAAP